MRLVPQSLSGRLLLAAAAAVLVAMLLAGFAVGLILQRFLTGQIDNRLDAQVFAIDAALDAPDGLERQRAVLDAPPFDRPRGGWVWIAEGPLGTFHSPSLVTRAPPVLPAAPPREPGYGRDGRPWPADGALDDGRPVHWRILRRDDGMTIAAAAPAGAIGRPLMDAFQTLALAFGVIAAALIGAALLQVRLGLRPLQNLRSELEAVRTGRQAAIGADQPSEVRPLADEINRLVAENAEGLARARRHAANLAHGLKTPLATLGAGLAARGDGEAGRQVEAMDRLIRHHLARARAAVLEGRAPRALSDAGERLRDLAGLMRIMHRDKAIGVDAVDGIVAVACEAQDFDEIFGNLMDNASKWARGRVRVRLWRAGASALVAVEDDGPGIAEDAMPEALRPGRRIDEATPGFGFGLPIAKELVELYGGDLALGRSELGGLEARVRLPLAR